MSKDPLFQDRASFLAWMSEMEAVTNQLFTLVGPAVAARLTFTVDSLDVLEAWLLHTFLNYHELLSPENAAAYDGAARYYGEVLRRAVGGEWVPCLESKRSSNYGYPTVDNYPGRGARIMPHFCITATIDRRQGNYLSSIVKRAQQHTE
jgi:hypothetical protein